MRTGSVSMEKGKQMPNCHNCTEKCPQAERAHEIAEGRMYATKEFVEIVKKIEGGQLVEVTYCKDCDQLIYLDDSPAEDYPYCEWWQYEVDPEFDYCSKAERKKNV